MTHGEQECDDYAGHLVVPKYYYVDKEGDRVYDTDLMFQHFEELIEELHNEREQRS